MSKNIIKETIANIVSNSKILKDFLNDPQPWSDYATKLLERTSPDYVEEVHTYHDDRLYKKQECDCSNCMYCLGMSWRDFM